MNGELVRLRIPRKDLFEFHDKIQKDYFYKYIKNIIKDDLYLKEFLNKGLVDGSIIDEESVSRTLFIINVIYHHAVEKNNIYLILSERSWAKIYSEYAKKFSLNIIFYRKIFPYNFKVIKKIF